MKLFSLIFVTLMVALWDAEVQSFPTSGEEKVKELELEDWTLVGSVGGKMFFTYLDRNVTYWWEAQSLCYSFDLLPAQINNEDERLVVHNFLMEKIKIDESKQYNSRQFWLDGVDWNSEKRWYSYRTKRPLKYLPWAVGQPDGGPNYDQENCSSYCGGCEPRNPGMNGFHDRWCYYEYSTQYYTIRPLCEFHIGGNGANKLRDENMVSDIIEKYHSFADSKADEDKKLESNAL